MDLVEDALLLLDAHVKSPPPFGNKSSVQAVESQDRRGHSTDRLAFTTGRRMRGVLILRTIEAVVESPGTRRWPAEFAPPRATVFTSSTGSGGRFREERALSQALRVDGTNHVLEINQLHAIGVGLS